MPMLTSVRRKRRNYHGNPLAYFREHFDRYKGMSRSELSIKDSGLYRILAKLGQLEEAIPEADQLRVESGRKGGKVSPISLDEIDKIVSAHQIFDGNSLKAEEHLPHDHHTIIKYWRIAEKEIRDQRALTQPEIEKIWEAHETYGENATEISRHVPYCVSTIIKYCRKANLKIRTQGESS